jgi:membrane protein
MGFWGFVKLLKGTVLEWNQDRMGSHAAALAYSAMLSLAPLLLLVSIVASSLLGDINLDEQLVSGSREIVGPEAARLIADIIRSGAPSADNWFVSVLGGVALLFGASGIFRQVRRSLGVIWHTRQGTRRPSRNLLDGLKTGLLAVGMAAGAGLSPLALFAISTTLAIPERFLVTVFPGVSELSGLVRFIAPPLLYAAIFALAYRFGPGAPVKWCDVWLGAVVGALLFWGGGYVLSLYISRSIIRSLYGAVSSVMVLLLWVYYAALIFISGAELTYAYANRYGSCSAGGECPIQGESESQ